ncbi:hypothetical protein KY284_032249 [Solanum tuberosum]|nr:hypothetical protein KY284_032249 [Solanum tuberosum]
MHKGASTSPQIRSYLYSNKSKGPGKSNCLKVVLSCKNFQLDGGGCHPSNSSMDRYLIEKPEYVKIGEGESKN